MKKIGVFHPLFGFGGGEAVCMNVLEALQSTYDLTLVTMTEVDIETMNEYYDTAVDPDLSVEPGKAVRKTFRGSQRALDRLTGAACGRLHVGLFTRFVTQHTDQFDLLVSTFGEYDFGVQSVQYIHLPMYNRHLFPPALKPGKMQQIYDKLCDITAGKPDRPDGTLIANSDWTAQITERLYGVQPETVYPPIAVDGFAESTWSGRENGFVTIGRVDRTKRIEDMIAIIQGVRDRGHDVHLHVIGPETDEAYSRSLRRQCGDDREIVFEGRLDRSRLIELIESHKFGLHAKRYEHFGMAVAELVAGGTIPFVHDSGGQREIVNRDDRLVYDSVAQAIEQIDWLLERPPEQRDARAGLPEVAAQYGTDRFQKATRAVIERTLGSTA
ncbi:glycosyltransferase family 4 protein [Halocatena halophila]|uniref:glycosyltransferase family 4 protein n=1 Tax=Halocatena halophila TaxID=2814576 RepID=UPI002ED50722